MSNTEDSKYDIIVVGGGPAGYVGAIRAAQLGMRVACVERDKLGGVCLNWGCIPTKALLAAAEFYQRVRQAENWGIHVENIGHDWSRVIGRSRDVAQRLNRGIEALFKKNRIEHVQGLAAVKGAGLVEARDENGRTTRQLRTDRVLVCTGATPRALPRVQFDGERIISSKEAMVLGEQPRKILIVGAGAIGMEFAYFYNAFGTQCTVVEMLPQVLPNEDEEVSRTVARSFKKQGIVCQTSTQVLEIEASKQSLQIILGGVEGDTPTQVVEADKMLVAIGVRGQIDGVFGPEPAAMGIELERDYIKVNRRTYETSSPGIYAVGDVIGPPWLAHVASDEAMVCVEKIAGRDGHEINYEAIPACTYCQPQVASLGLTEQACRKEGKRRGEGYQVASFPFMASGKAQALGSTEGFVKIISEPQYGEILGAHMVGEGVTELLAEVVLAKHLEGTAADLMATMHAHPTLSEAIHEAALGIAGRMIHA